MGKTVIRSWRGLSADEHIRKVCGILMQNIIKRVEITDAEEKKRIKASTFGCVALLPVFVRRPDPSSPHAAFMNTGHK